MCCQASRSDSLPRRYYGTASSSPLSASPPPALNRGAASGKQAAAALAACGANLLRSPGRFASSPPRPKRCVPDVRLAKSRHWLRAGPPGDRGDLEAQPATPRAAIPQLQRHGNWPWRSSLRFLPSSLLPPATEDEGRGEGTPGAHELTFQGVPRPLGFRHGYELPRRLGGSP